jgi:hypothetical protein
MSIDPEDQRSVAPTPKQLHIEEGAFQVYTFNCRGSKRGSCGPVASFAQKLGFKCSCLRWVPYLLTGELRTKREELTGRMIPDLSRREKTVENIW